jgi:hypothetical protein
MKGEVRRKVNRVHGMWGGGMEGVARLLGGGDKRKGRKPWGWWRGAVGGVPAHAQPRRGKGRGKGVLPLPMSDGQPTSA